MRRIFMTLMATAALLSAATAEKIDLSTMTCAKFQGSPGDEVKLILTWLDAYYRDEKDPPVIDTELFVANAKKLGEYCTANPTIGLITATDKLFQK
jgi:acid stress chaperone HdeB